MSEFKTVVENIETKLKVITEGISSIRLEMKDEFRLVKHDIYSLKEQVALLHEGQTEIKNELKQKVSRDEFGRLEMRVAKLENKAA